MTIKINRARKMSPWGNYPATWNDIISAIPAEIIDALTSMQLVELIDANQKIYNAGKAYNQKEIDDFFGFGFWNVDWAKVDIDSLPRQEKSPA